MPTVSKFRTQTRERVLQILQSGGSRRAACRAAGIDGATLHRWLAKGRDAHPEGRWHEFYLRVREAEGTPPELVVLRDEFDRMLGDPALAWKFLLETEEGFGLPDPPEPLKVVVTFGEYAPPIGKDSA